MLKALPPSILAYLIEESTDAVLIMDAECKIRYVNPAMAKLSGYDESQLIGHSINTLLPEDVAAVHDSYVRAYIEGKRAATVLGRVRELELRHRAGELIPIELKAVDLGSESGTRYFGAFFIDIRLRKKIEARQTALVSHLQRQALTDELTGLPNRRAFDSEAARIAAHAHRAGWPVTVGIIDIDHFKAVNDRFGHAAGDTVLCSVASAIRHSLRAGDLCARLGGEEFGLLLPNATVLEARFIAERIRTQLSSHSVILPLGSRVGITVSCGLSIVAVDSGIDEALRRADSALYRAKSTGRNRTIALETVE